MNHEESQSPFDIFIKLVHVTAQTYARRTIEDNLKRGTGTYSTQDVEALFVILMAQFHERLELHVPKVDPKRVNFEVMFRNILSMVYQEAAAHLIQGYGYRPT